MRYLLPEYSMGRFNAIDDLVRMCHRDLLTKRWGSPITALKQIGSSMEGLDRHAVKYIESFSATDELNGVCFHASLQEPFTVWLNPDMEPGGIIFELTLIHELCHGYLGSRKMHDKDWRAYYGRTALLYNHLINWEFFDPEWHVKHTIRRYRGEEKTLTESFGDYSLACELELEQVVREVEDNMPRIARDFRQLREMRRSCQRFTSVSTPTPAYLASLPKRVGTEFR